MEKRPFCDVCRVNFNCQEQLHDHVLRRTDGRPNSFFCQAAAFVQQPICPFCSVIYNTVQYSASPCLIVAVLPQLPGSTDGRTRPIRAHQPAQRTIAGWEQITVCVAQLGTSGGYDMTKYEYMETGGVGCKVCLRWMHFNNHESHRTGKKHKKEVDKLMEDHRQHNIFKPDAKKHIFGKLCSHAILAGSPCCLMIRM